MKPVERKIHEKHMHRDILSLPSQANTGQAFREEKHTHSLTHTTTIITITVYLD